MQLMAPVKKDLLTFKATASLGLTNEHVTVSEGILENIQPIVWC